jgi:hypothetical protein
VSNVGITELAREYQEYVIAHRTRAVIGGRLEPKAFLRLPEYARKRLQRQKLAREVVTVKPFSPERLRAVDDLTDELCFGMWRNPREINDFLRAVWRSGGHAILESEQAFVNVLLMPEERGRCPEGGLEVARFHHACLKMAAAWLNPEEMELAAGRVEDMAQNLPLFLDVFHNRAA